MGDLFGSYAGCLHGPGSPELGSVQQSGAWDEMFESGGEAEPLSPRPHYVPLHDVLGTLSAEDYGARCLATRQELPGPGHYVFSLGRAATVPARPGPQGRAGRGMGGNRAGRGPGVRGPRGIPS